MTDHATRRRIWGWMFFDWAQQPYATLGLTFVFAPYFAAVASDVFMAQGLAETAAEAETQGLWSLGQTLAGLVVAFSAPFLGAWADATGRKLPWIYGFVLIAIACAAALWMLAPSGEMLMLALALFWIGFVASESAFNLNNALLPGLGRVQDMGRISGNAGAFGYWGGVLALFLMLLLFVEQDNGKTLIGLSPPFGLDAEQREGTRSVGPFIALWFALFLIPYVLWVREPAAAALPGARFGAVLDDLWTSVKSAFRRRSCASFLLGSMFYRDALSGLYTYGGIYARQVLDWSIVQIGVFGIVAAIAAAVVTWIGGLADSRYGPKPVIVTCVSVLSAVGLIIIGMTREQVFGVPLPDGSVVPDVIFYGCGVVIGGAGGVLYSASRSMMVRHCDPARPAEGFGLFALTGKATAFLAPALIGLVTALTQNTQLGYIPIVALFLLGLVLLIWVHPEGDRAE